MESQLGFLLGNHCISQVSYFDITVSVWFQSGNIRWHHKFVLLCCDITIGFSQVRYCDIIRVCPSGKLRGGYTICTIKLVVGNQQPPYSVHVQGSTVCVSSLPPGNHNVELPYWANVTLLGHAYGGGQSVLSSISFKWPAWIMSDLLSLSWIWYL